jgi:hypothetical protein
MKVEGRRPSVHTASAMANPVDQELTRYVPEVIVEIINSFFVNDSMASNCMIRDGVSMQVGQSGHPAYVYSRAIGWGTTLRGMAYAGHTELVDEYIKEIMRNGDSRRQKFWLNHGLGGACAGQHVNIVATLITHGADDCDFCYRDANEHLADIAHAKVEWRAASV